MYLPDKIILVKNNFESSEIKEMIDYSIAEKQWEFYKEIVTLQKYAQKQGENLDFAQACEIVKLFRSAKNSELILDIYDKLEKLEKQKVSKNKTAP